MQRDHSTDPDGKTILTEIDGSEWIAFTWFRTEPSDGLCGHSDKLLGFKNCEKFLDWLRNQQFFEKNYPPWCLYMRGTVTLNLWRIN